MGLTANKTVRNQQRIQINQPSDGDGNVMQLMPAKEAEAVTNIASLSSVTAQDISLQDNTGLVEIICATEGDGGVFVKYATGATSSDFDDYVRAGDTRQYVIPINVDTISVLGSVASLNVIVIEK